MRADGKGLTAGVEILRGDLARILRDALPRDVGVRFGRSISSVSDSSTDSAEVTFASGDPASYDLVVIAEGARSSTRDLVFGADVERRRLGLTMVYGTIPRRDSDDRWWHWYAAPGGRQITARPDGNGTRRATMSYRTDEAGELAGVQQAEMVARLRTTFAGAGWQAERILDGFAGSDDVYADDLTQIRLPSWRRGRVCVVGDAAWCVTPLGGGGCSLALLGGYVLGAALSRHPTGDATDEQAAIDAALSEYEEWLRPDVEKVQGLPPGIVAASHPRSRTGVRLQRAALRVGALPPVRRLVQRFGGDTLRALPEAAFVR